MSFKNGFYSVLNENILLEISVIEVLVLFSQYMFKEFYFTAKLAV